MTIDLCLAAFPWALVPAHERRDHGQLNIDSTIGVDQLCQRERRHPRVTDGKTGDVTVARTWTFPCLIE